MRLCDLPLRSTFPQDEAVRATDDAFAKLEASAPPWVTLSDGDEIDPDLALAADTFGNAIAHQAHNLGLLPDKFTVLPEYPPDQTINLREWTAGVLQHIFNAGGQFAANDEGWGLRSPDGRATGILAE